MIQVRIRLSYMGRTEGGFSFGFDKGDSRVNSAWVNNWLTNGLTKSIEYSHYLNVGYKHVSSVVKFRVPFPLFKGSSCTWIQIVEVVIFDSLDWKYLKFFEYSSLLVLYVCICTVPYKLSIYIQHNVCLLPSSMTANGRDLYF